MTSLRTLFLTLFLVRVWKLTGLMRHARTHSHGVATQVARAEGGGRHTRRILEARQRCHSGTFLEKLHCLTLIRYSIHTLFHATRDFQLNRRVEIVPRPRRRHTGTTKHFGFESGSRWISVHVVPKHPSRTQSGCAGTAQGTQGSRVFHGRGTKSSHVPEWMAVAKHGLARLFFVLKLLGGLTRRSLGGVRARTVARHLVNQVQPAFLEVLVVEASRVFSPVVTDVKPSKSSEKRREMRDDTIPLTEETQHTNLYTYRMNPHR